MTTIRPTILFGEGFDDDKPYGKDIRPIIPKDVAPNPDGNKALPPRTNLRGFPSAFQDQITSSGGGPNIMTEDHYIGMPTPGYVRFKEWLSNNTTPLILIGIIVFGVLSVSR